jgi:hypothetical protein
LAKKKPRERVSSLNRGFFRFREVAAPESWWLINKIGRSVAGIKKKKAPEGFLPGGFLG